MTYFCRCFLCESTGECAHREPELVIWWRLVVDREGERARRRVYDLITPPVFVAAPEHQQIEAPAEVPIPLEVAIEAPKPALKRKLFTRAEALRQAEHSGLRGW